MFPSAIFISSLCAESLSILVRFLAWLLSSRRKKKKKYFIFPSQYRAFVQILLTKKKMRHLCSLRHVVHKRVRANWTLKFRINLLAPMFICYHKLLCSSLETSSHILHLVQRHGTREKAFFCRLLTGAPVKRGGVHLAVGVSRCVLNSFREMAPLTRGQRCTQSCTVCPERSRVVLRSK